MNLFDELQVALKSRREPDMKLVPDCLRLCTLTKEEANNKERLALHTAQVSKWNELRGLNRWAPLLSSSCQPLELEGRVFGCESDVQLNLRQSTLDGAKLNGACLQYVDLRESTFIGATLIGVDFRDAILMNTDFSGADLTEAQFQKEAPECRTNLGNARFVDAILVETKFDRADLDNAKFQCAILHSGSFTHALLRGANFGEARLKRTKFNHADLHRACLAGAYLYGADFLKAELNEANLSGAKFHKLRSSILADFPEYKNAWSNPLVYCRAIRDELRGPKINLAGADLSDAQLPDVQYRVSKLLGSCKGCYVATTRQNPILKRDIEDQDFIDSLHDRWNETYHIVFWKLWKATDFGRGLGRVATWGLLWTIFFGLVFSIFPDMFIYETEAIRNHWFTPFYYSIVTYTTLGFGDITPKSGWGMYWVTFEVVLGYFTLGLLISILANKVARRAS